MDIKKIAGVVRDGWDTLEDVQAQLSDDEIVEICKRYFNFKDSHAKSMKKRNERIKFALAYAERNAGTRVDMTGGEEEEG